MQTPSSSGCLGGFHGRGGTPQAGTSGDGQRLLHWNVCSRLGVFRARTSESRRDRLPQLSSAEHPGSCWLCSRTPAPLQGRQLRPHAAAGRSAGGRGVPWFTVAKTQRHKCKCLGGRWRCLEGDDSPEHAQNAQSRLRPGQGAVCDPPTEDTEGEAPPPPGSGGSTAASAHR